MPLFHWCCKAGQETFRTDNLKAIAIRSSLALTCIAFLQFSVGCGGGSGTSGGGPPPPPSNPTPAITSLSPSSANEGGSAFTITVTGYNFISSSSVLWNGSARTTTYTSSTQLQAQITAADIANSGSAQLSITNPAPGGGSSGAAEFIISPTSNPAPTVLSGGRTSDAAAVRGDAGSDRAVADPHGIDRRWPDQAAESVYKGARQGGGVLQKWRNIGQFRLCWFGTSYRSGRSG